MRLEGLWGSCLMLVGTGGWRWGSCTMLVESQSETGTAQVARALTQNTV